MSDYGQRHKPPTTADPGQRQASDGPRFLPGVSVEADRHWAQNRIANFFRANATPPRVARNAADGGEGARRGGAEVSLPGDPAEKEADAVADHVADELHGGGKERDGAEVPAAGKEQAPAIGAKLKPGTIARAGKDPLKSTTRDALGAGPTTSGMRVGNAQQAGVTRTPRHHVFPQEQRAWFSDRGFDIDQYCVEQSEGEHSALHTMGWNAAIMNALQEAEQQLKRKLKPNEIVATGRRVMGQFGIANTKFVPYKDT